MKKQILILFFILIITPALNAQKLSLTEADKKEFTQKAIRMIELFKESLTIIPTISNNQEDGFLKNKAIRNVLRIFIKDATMQLAYSNGSKSKPIRMGKYLSSLADYEAKRELVNIEIIDFTVEDIEPHPTELGKYIIKFEFVQRFSKKKNYTSTNRLNNEKFEEIEWDYADVTKKSGIGILEKVNTRNGTKWLMLLGDIEANDIELIKN